MTIAFVYSAMRQEPLMRKKIVTRWGGVLHNPNFNPNPNFNSKYNFNYNPNFYHNHNSYFIPKLQPLS